MRFLVLLFVAVSSQIMSAQQPLRVYIGTGGDAIYTSMFDPESGKLSSLEVAGETRRPSFLWLCPDTKSLVSVSEFRQGQQTSNAQIVSWNVDAVTGRITQTGAQEARGNGPCYVSVNRSRTHAAIANYGSGSVSVYPVAKDGSVGTSTGHVQHVGSSIDKARQTGPHAHSVMFDPSDKRVIAADLGTDQVYLYDLNSDGSLSPSTPPNVPLDPGTGPRHFAFSPDGKYLLVLGELSGTITTYRYAPPEVTKIAVVETMAPGTPADAPRASAEILFHPNGQFVYCCNRGPNEMVCLRYDATSGKLERLLGVSCGGDHPRNFRLSPDGRFLLVANQMSNNIEIFAVNDQTGELTPTGQNIELKSPMCIKFWDPRG
jgi:6-phosphogluconolactonase